MLQLALTRGAWPVLLEMQSLMNERVLLAYLTKHNAERWHDTMPDAARQILIDNASLEELSEIRARFEGTRVAGYMTYWHVMREEGMRQGQRGLAMGMMSHKRLARESGPWQQSVAENRDIMATIRGFL